jgi:hypothetical protein
MWREPGGEYHATGWERSMKKTALNRRVNLWPTGIAAALLIAMANIAPAAAQGGAQTSSQPACDQPEMTFTTWSSNLGRRFGEGQREYIFADGYICANTDSKFQQYLTKNPPQGPNTIVVLNSGGGDLGAGLRMGRIIRQRKMWTQVGSQLPLMIPQNENIPSQSVPYLAEPSSPPFAGECASACTFTFMGGIHRIISYVSNYGVHQFESTQQDPNLEADTEATSAELAAFLNEMGISPNYLVFMVKKRGNDVTNLTMRQMQELNIITPRWQTKWQIAPLADNTGFYLDGITIDPWGTHDIAVTCAPKPDPAQQGQNPTVLRATIALDPGVRAKAQDLVGAVQAYGLVLSGNFVPVKLSAKQAQPTVVSGRLTTTLNVPQGLVDALRDIPAVGLAFMFDPAAKLPMRLLRFEANARLPAAYAIRRHLPLRRARQFISRPNCVAGPGVYQECAA